MKTLTVQTAQPYDIVIGKGILKDCATAASALFPQAKTVIVTDDNVEPLYAATVQWAFEKAGIKYFTFVIPNGEASKNMDNLTELLNFMAAHQCDGGDFITALGGGVVGDLAGFAAATYFRGIPWIQLPTTLLAMVDASVGGKTAVNLETGKNLVGAFHQPSLVWCDHDTLTTMTAHRFADGVAEAIKCAILRDEAFFEKMREVNLDRNIEDIIVACVTLKSRLVTADEHDRNQRRYLNLGHTIGHAIEAHSNYTITHGAAVACGLTTIAEIAAKNGLAEFDCHDRIAAVLKLYDLPTKSPFPLEDLMPYIENDKKRNGDLITLVIPESIGHCRLLKVHMNKLRTFFRI